MTVCMATGPAHCQQACLNMCSEDNLPESAWCSLADTLSALSPAERADASRLMREIAQCFRQHVLQGPKVALGSSATLGHVVPTLTFQNHVEARLLMSPGTLRKKIRSELEANAVPFQELCDAVPVRSGPLMWSTFNEASPDHPPLADIVPLTCENLCGVLGLAPHVAHQALLMLRYNLEVGGAACKPTIADAYFGNPDYWNRHFRPSAANAPWGRTATWPTYRGQPASKPEVVHPPISGGQLTGVDELQP